MADPDSSSPASERAARDAFCLRTIAAGQGTATADACLRELIGRYQRLFIGHCLRNSQSLADAEDIVQRVWMKIYRNAGSFRANASPSTWMSTILRHALIDHARRPGHEVELTEEIERSMEVTGADDGSGGMPGGQREALNACIDGAFSVFAKAHLERADALRKVECDDWPIRDLAEYLGRTEAATRQYLTECRKKFRPFLERCRELLDPQVSW